MKKLVLAAAISALVSGTAFAYQTTPVATEFEIEKSTLDISKTSYEQTNLTANVAGGLAVYGSGVGVAQTARADSDQRPATTSLEIEHSSIQGSQYSNGGWFFPSSGSEFSANKGEFEAKTTGTVPSSATAGNTFQGQAVGGSSAVNYVLPDGTVSSTNITEGAQAVGAVNGATAVGNADAGAGQVGGAAGAGLAGGLAANIEYQSVDAKTFDMTKTSFEMEASSRPVLPGFHH